MLYATNCERQEPELRSLRSSGDVMTLDFLERDDLSVYVVAGVPKSFKKKLARYLSDESAGEGNLMLLDEKMTEWLLARLKGKRRRSHQQTPASSALWRAYRSLSAARYHLSDQPLEGRVRELRSDIEQLWRITSPTHNTEDEPSS